MQIVEDSGYTRNVLAANLAKNKRSTAVAMLVPDMTNYYYMQMFNEMVSCARKYGYTIMIYSISTDTLDEVVNEVVGNRVCGIVNLGLDSISEDSLKKVRAAGIRMIYPGWPEDEFYQFHTDYGKGMAEAMAALKEEGRKSLLPFRNEAAPVAGRKAESVFKIRKGIRVLCFGGGYFLRGIYRSVCVGRRVPFGKGAVQRRNSGTTRGFA